MTERRFAETQDSAGDAAARRVRRGAVALVLLALSVAAVVCVSRSEGRRAAPPTSPGPARTTARP